MAQEKTRGVQTFDAPDFMRGRPTSIDGFRVYHPDLTHWLAPANAGAA
jgi:hypothetical protein